MTCIYKQVRLKPDLGSKKQTKYMQEFPAKSVEIQPRIKFNIMDKPLPDIKIPFSSKTIMKTDYTEH